jgi:type I restriction enzyme R subunit
MSIRHARPQLAIERKGEPHRVSLEVMIRGACDRTRLLDLVENFTLF